MSSYQNSASAQWEEEFIKELFSENDISDDNHQNNVSENEHVQSYYQSYSQDANKNQDQIKNINNVENSTLLSPTWDNQPFFNTENNITMSTYFSTFNPVQPQPQIRIPVSNQSAQLKKYHINYTKALEKIHRARISLVPTSGNFKPVIKRKRKRTVFTTEQIEALETYFSRKPYVTREDRQVLVNQLNLSDKSVKIWFQNRRLKGKRDDSDCESTGQDFSKLDYVESKISERTNEFGYVTLDDRIMNDLVDVIDDFLSRSPVNIVPTAMEVETSPIYEPISPASTLDDDSNEGNNTLCSYEETVQQLIDIESIISV